MTRQISELTWERASGKPPFEGFRLDQVMAYYHNDQEEGFGVGLDGRLPNSDLEVRLERAFNAYKVAWDVADEEHRQQMLDDYMLQVEDAAGEGREGRTYPIVILIMNVIWLVAYGRMADDEYNGPQFMWAKGALILNAANR